MSEKTNLLELVNLLSDKAKITKKEAETFLKECFLCMEEGLLEDKSLKIKDLGTFKLTLIKDRESVNVSTGERMIIPSHYKISFTADKDLSEAINEPFSLFQVEEIYNDGKTTSPGTKPKEKEEIEKPKKTKKTEKEKEVEEVEETKEVETEAPKDEIPSMKTDIFWDLDMDDHSRVTKKRRKRKRFNWKVFLITITAILFPLFILYVEIIERNPNFKINLDTFKKLYSITINHFKKEPVIIEESPDIITLPNDSTFVLPSDSIAFPTDSLGTIISEEGEVSEQTQPDIKKRTLQQGESLTTIALNEYGNKTFWVYIYEENKDKISGPNNVRAGVELIIPPASKYGIDKNDPESIKKAKEIQSRF